MTAPAKRRANERERLLLATLSHVAFDGWTTTARARGAADCGLAEAEAERLFPGGALDLITAFSTWADGAMVRAIAAEAPAEHSVAARIAHAVTARLAALAPHREAARRAAQLLALPTNAPKAAELLYRTVDLIWYETGDRSVDFSYYTKRASLGLIYATTLLVWLDDSSPGFAATRAFLDRRLADIARLGRARARMATLAARLPDPFGVIAGRPGRG